LVAYDKPKRQGGQIQNSNFQMFKTAQFFVEYDFLCFGRLSFRDSVIVSNFDLPAMPLRRFRVVPQSECYFHRHYSLLKHFAWQAGIRISYFPACPG
jgi:hypothetical protein